MANDSDALSMKVIKFVGTVAGTAVAIVVWSLLYFAPASRLADEETAHQALAAEIAEDRATLATLQVQIKTTAAQATIGVRDHDAVVVLEVKAGMSPTDSDAPPIAGAAAVAPSPVPTPSPGGPP